MTLMVSKKQRKGQDQVQRRKGSSQKVFKWDSHDDRINQSGKTPALD